MPIVSNTRFSLVAFLLAVAAIIIVYILLRDTTWGLRLKAIGLNAQAAHRLGINLSLIHISEPTRLLSISYAVLCLKKKNTQTQLLQLHIPITTRY